MNSHAIPFQRNLYNIRALHVKHFHAVKDDIFSLQDLSKCSSRDMKLTDVSTYFKNKLQIFLNFKAVKEEYHSDRVATADCTRCICIQVKAAILLTEQKCRLVLRHWARKWIYYRQSVTHGRCDDRPTVTFPAAEHCHCPLAGTHFPSSFAESRRLSRPEWLVT